jgi:1,4-alpha-glucan branching enzyme
MIRKQRIKDTDRVKVTFVLPEGHSFGKVAVVGDMNHWDPYTHPFKRRNNQTYSTSLVLDQGNRYSFRYLGTDGKWANDEAADGYEWNEFGEQNSVLIT